LQAARSDISTRPNPYKLLYAFEMHQQNWRMAATYIYLYSTLLKSEMSMSAYQNTSLALQERLNGISAAINCLHLVHPIYACIDVQMASQLPNASHPSKKARTLEEKCKDIIFFFFFGGGVELRFHMKGRRCNFDIAMCLT